MSLSNPIPQHREGALNVNSMNVKYGGKQKTPRESRIPLDPIEAAAYFGPYPAKLKPGDTQHFYFQAWSRQYYIWLFGLQMPPTLAHQKLELLGVFPVGLESMGVSENPWVLGCGWAQGPISNAFLPVAYDLLCRHDRRMIRRLSMMWQHLSMTYRQGGATGKGI